jgi:integrase
MWTDLDANRVYTHLASLRGDAGIGQRTFNAYLKTVKHFARWMIQERRATSSPLEHLRCVTQTEKRRERRALSLEEQRQLLTVTAQEPARYNMTGPERSLVYRVALETGLRANEIRQLTPAAFDFEACTVSLSGTYTKNKQAAELDLKRQTAAEIKVFLTDKPPNARAFAMPCCGSRMIKVDLAAAGIDYRDSAGRVADFHSLRHSFVTNLARAGVHPSDAQALARHSTIALTMNCYTHSLRADLKRIINEQPDLSIAPKNLSVACLGKRVG